MFLLSPYFYPAVLKLPIVDSVFLPWYLCFYPAGNDDGVCITVTTSCWRETLMLVENMSSKWLCLGCERFNIWGPRQRVRTSCSRSSKNHAGWVRPRVCPFPLPSFGLSRCFCFGYYYTEEMEGEEGRWVRRVLFYLSGIFLLDSSYFCYWRWAGLSRC